MSRRKTLESLVKGQERHVKHFDPLEAISHHVVFLVFISLLFLMGAFMFLASEPSASPTATYALYEFEPITLHKDIATSISDFVENVRHSENRPLVMLVLYTFWIILFGLINMVLYERQVRR